MFADIIYETPVCVTKNIQGNGGQVVEGTGIRRAELRPFDVPGSSDRGFVYQILSNMIPKSGKHLTASPFTPRQHALYSFDNIKHPGHSLTT